MLDTVRNAEQVEALPIRADGTGPMKRTPIGLIVALLVSAVSPAFAQDRCEPSACLAAILAKVAVSVADVPASDVAGLWTGGEGMLNGENLYLFPDGSYIYTEWGDVLPETIYDKGAWSIEGGVVRFTPDAAVVWTPGSDRRFVALLPPTATEVLLVGIDRTLETFLDLVREHPETTPLEWLEVSALKRKGGITAGEAEALTRRLHEEGWRPGFFDEAQEVESSQRELYELLTTIDHPDRVEALPVSTAGEGMGSRPRVEERPSPVDAKTGSLRRNGSRRHGRPTRRQEAPGHVAAADVSAGREEGVSREVRPGATMTGRADGYTPPF